MLTYVYLLSLPVWPFVFVCNLVNALKPQENPMMPAPRTSVIWAGIALFMLTAAPVYLFIFGV